MIMLDEFFFVVVVVVGFFSSFFPFLDQFYLYIGLKIKKNF